MNVYNFRTWIHTILKKDGVESAQTAESESSEESELCTDTTDMRGTGSAQQRYCYSLILIEIAALILLVLRWIKTTIQHYCILYVGLIDIRIIIVVLISF